MKELLHKAKARISPLHRGRIFYIVLVVAGLFLIGASSYDLIAAQREYASARAEYEHLQELYPVTSVYPPPAPATAIPNSSGTGDAVPSSPIPSPSMPDAEYQIPDAPGSEQPDSLAGLAALNPDFIGWISIAGVLDYPVVLGSDNSFYLHVTFYGQHNSAGAIFMDCRNTHGFDEPVCILYGHNMRDGSMFAPLKRYLDRTFLAAHPDLVITAATGEVLDYRVFAARRTDTWDSAYSLDFADGAAAAEAFKGAPDGASRFLLLSTCVSGADKDERLLVYAALMD